IMKYRFSDRLTTSFAIEDGLDDALVPAFVLQPLVENAIEHGISRIRRPGALELRIERCGDRLHITVRDNGPGLVDPTALPFGSAASPGKAGLVDPTALPFGSAASPGKAGRVDPTALPFGSAASPGKAGRVDPTALPF